ncbi:MAG: vitamin K-dependent gamma-carboxylase, partial [Myxococcota bacterium]
MTSPRPSQFLQRANAPIDPASLIAFRILFGVVMVFSAIRFVVNDWVTIFFAKPGFHFAFYGFEWVRPLSPALMTVGVVTLGVLAALIALGVAYRFAIVAFAVLFTWIELTDVTNYLNHYYLVSLLAFLMCFLPLGRKATGHRAWMVWLLRFQVGLVYVFAAVAKCNADWLLEGQPLGIWLAARTDTPILGWLVGQPHAALVCAWCGFLYDVLIVPALLWRRTRVAAFGVLVVFHITTRLLFDIGMFPLIMTAAATLFFAPDWPRRWLRLPVAAPGSGGKLPRLGAIAIAAWMTLHLALPARSLLYEGPVNWHEQGMRFAWKVMVREKS